MASQQQFCIKWNGQEFQIDVGTGDTVESMKRLLFEKTQVDPKRQKLIGLKTKAGKLATDDVSVGDLVIKPNAKIMMMGQPEAVVKQVEEQALAAPEVQDDFDLRPEDELSVEVKDQPEVQAKLQRRISSVEVKVLNPPRQGKKCLVLDIDYTLFDLGSSAERPDELARPYLHEFLTACYEYYDIIIWSATSIKVGTATLPQLVLLTCWHRARALAELMQHLRVETPFRFF
jgi:ubiquitin-like domain-containing CTD phosphatase 1